MSVLLTFSWVRLIFVTSRDFIKRRQQKEQGFSTFSVCVPNIFLFNLMNLRESKSILKSLKYSSIPILAYHLNRSCVPNIENHCSKAVRKLLMNSTPALRSLTFLCLLIRWFNSKDETHRSTSSFCQWNPIQDSWRERLWSCHRLFLRCLPQR